MRIDQLKALIQEGEYWLRSLNPPAEVHEFVLPDTPTFISLAQHFAETITLENRPSNLPHNIIRIGLVGMPGHGKTTFSEAVINYDPNFIRDDRSMGAQITGISELFGAVCRADCETRIIDDYNVEPHQARKWRNARTEFVEHIQGDFRSKEKMQAIFIFDKGPNQPTLPTGYPDRSAETPITMRALLGAELLATQATQKFLAGISSITPPQSLAKSNLSMSKSI